MLRIPFPPTTELFCSAFCVPIFRTSLIIIYYAQEQAMCSRLRKTLGPFSVFLSRLYTLPRQRDSHKLNTDGDVADKTVAEV